MNVVIIILAIIALPFIVAVFLSKDYAIEREIIINRPKHEVFEYLKHIRNQDDYSTWVMMDPEMKKEFRGIDGTVGFIYAWEGKKAGMGEQEITGIAEGERVTMEIRFVKPFKNTGHVYQATEAISEHSTRVSWGISGRTPYPLNLMTSLMKGKLGKDIYDSLKRLKGNLENSNNI